MPFPRGGGGGFYQSLYTTGQDVETGDPMTDGVLVNAAGLTFSGNSYTYNGETYAVSHGSTAAYKTYWKMTGGTTYRFVKNYDDNGRIRITGPDGVTTEVLHNTTYNAVAYATYTPSQTGWHTLELRVGDGTGDIGPTTSPFKDAAKLGAGLAWTTAEVTDCTDANYSQWNRFENREGESPIFRVKLSDVTMDAVYDAANKCANVSVTLVEVPSAVCVTVDYPTTDGVETLVLAEGASASATPLTAQVPLIAGATSRLTVRVLDGDEELDSADFCVYAGDISIAAGGDADINTGTKGSFVISRGTSDAATAESLVVNYTVGGTAARASEVNVGLAAPTGDWFYDTAAGTISYGGWVLEVQEDKNRLQNGLAITKLVSQGSEAKVLNLAKSVKDASGNEFRIVGVGNEVFMGNTNLNELHLSEDFYWFGDRSFQSCTALTKVSPLFPDSVESFGTAAFNDCSIEGDLRLGFGTSQHDVSMSQFNFQRNRFTSLSFGPRCKNLGSFTFASCKQVKSITFDEQLMNFRIGERMFQDCSGVERIAPSCLPKGLAGMSDWSFCGLVSCRGTLELCMGDYTYGIPKDVFKESGFDEIVFGEKFGGKFTGGGSFRSMANLRRIRFLGDANFDFSPENESFHFFDDKPYTKVVEIPNPDDNASWKAVLEDEAQVTPWAKVSDEAKAAYRANFPGEQNPKGLIIVNWKSMSEGTTGTTRTLIDSWITYQNKAGFTIRLR